MSKTVRISLPLLSASYFLIFFCWLVYRYFTRNIELIDAFIAKPFIYVMPVIIIYLWKKISFSELGFRKLSIRNFILSFFSAVGLAAIQFIPQYFRFHVLFSLSPNFMLIALATIGTAISEEILFRGFVFKELRNYISVINSTIITSILFTVMHLPILIFIYSSTGLDLFTTLYLIFLSSIVFCLLYSYTKNLWSPIIAHFLFDILLLLF